MSKKSYEDMGVLLSNSHKLIHITRKKQVFDTAIQNILILLDINLCIATISIANLKSMRSMGA